MRGTGANVGSSQVRPTVTPEVANALLERAGRATVACGLGNHPLLIDATFFGDGELESDVTMMIMGSHTQEDVESWVPGLNRELEKEGMTCGRLIVKEVGSMRYFLEINEIS